MVCQAARQPDAGSAVLTRKVKLRSSWKSLRTNTERVEAALYPGPAVGISPRCRLRHNNWTDIRFGFVLRSGWLQGLRPQLYAELNRLAVQFQRLRGLFDSLHALVAVIRNKNKPILRGRRRNEQISFVDAKRFSRDSVR